MGKRRIRLMRQMDPELVIIGVDAKPERIREAEELFGIRCVPGIPEALAYEPSCAFVCTSPLSHAGIITSLLNAGLHVFTEINLVADQYPELIDLAGRQGKTLFLSSTFLYRRDIRYMIDRVRQCSALGQKVNYIYHTGQYLPDWHPWENYKDFFVNDVRTNGCREIMAIEFPWLISCFGGMSSIFSDKGEDMSGLGLGYPDNYLMMIGHENGNRGIAAVDVVSRKARRSLEIFGGQVHLFWEGTPDSLMEYDADRKVMNRIDTYERVEKDSRYCDNIIENAYMDEIVAFFHEVKTGKKDMTRYSFAEDMETLRWVDRAEECAR